MYPKYLNIYKPILHNKYPEKRIKWNRLMDQNRR